MSLLTDRKWKVRYDSDEDNLIEEFYEPALSSAVRYDRTTGYYSARILTLVLRGIESFVRNGGRMRLVAGCILREEDVAAIEKGYSLRDAAEQSIMANPLAATDEKEADALELLSWLVYKGTLEVKLAITCNPMSRKPVAGTGVFHAKAGVIEDKAGNRLAFSGSVNETMAGWQLGDGADVAGGNWEDFHVFLGWAGGADHVEAQEEHFQKIWADQSKRCLVVDVPKAVKDDLLRFMPKDGGLPKILIGSGHGEDNDSKDGNGEPPPPPDPSTEELRRLVWGIIKNAPAALNGGERVGEATSAVTPWPHQIRAFHRMYDKWPPKLLIADEVGLGKTIEAGMLVRQAWLSGRAKRILILAPRAVLSQWQIELREKFGLNWPIYDGQKLSWYPTIAFGATQDKQVGPEEWHREACVLTSSQLMRRRDRASELLENAEQYDLIILDEAHHARGRGAGGDGEARPNELLRLMGRLREKTEGLVLMTATPMQVHPREVWDLLRLLGLPEEWTFSRFERFFEEAASSNPTPQEFEDMASLFRALERDLGETSSEDVRRFVPTGSRIAAKRILDALKGTPEAPRRVLSQEDRKSAVKAMKAGSPVGRLISRHTRELLRKYQAAGKLDSPIAVRDVSDELVVMSQEEREVYEAVEEYISTKYNQASPKDRSAIGFVMTVYRKRVASSFYALAETLDRRLKKLDGQQSALGTDDIGSNEFHDETLDLDEAEELERQALQLEERSEIESLLSMTRSLPVDTKAQALAKLLDHLKTDGYRQAMVFTQFTDTIDFLRRYLTESRGMDVLCFSGRGGEYRSIDGTWRVISRDEVKRMFREGQGEVLLCNEAAAEGLNFQFCGALLNYDMPWNPMAVEQRIGRIDRLGQLYPKIKIQNLHYEDTIETDVYLALRKRINLFSQFIGKLQPILARLDRRIQSMVFDLPEDRGARRRELVNDLDSEIAEAEGAAFDLDEITDSDLEIPSRADPVYDLSALDKLLQRPELLPNGVSATPMGNGEYGYMSVGLKEPTRVTTNPDYYSDHPDSTELWSPGSPLFPDPASFATEEEVNAFKGKLTDLLT